MKAARLAKRYARRIRRYRPGIRLAEAKSSKHIPYPLVNVTEGASAGLGSRLLNNRQVLPLAIHGLQLMHAPIIGVEEVASVRDRVVVRRTHGPPGPPATARSSPSAAMLSGFLGKFNTVLHFVLDTGQ